MIVYRMCSENELYNIIENESFDDVSQIYFRDFNKNTFCYDLDKKYLHFYDSLDSIKYMITPYKNVLCLYNIPNDVLSMNTGFGYYGFNVLKEYAIANDELDFSYLNSAFKISNSSIDDLSGKILYKRKGKIKKIK